MGDYTDPNGVGRNYTPSQLDRVAYERTCERCGVESARVRTCYVAPHGAGCYRGRFCPACWAEIKPVVAGHRVGLGLRAEPCESHGLRSYWPGWNGLFSVQALCYDCDEPVHTEGWSFYWLNPVRFGLDRDDWFGVRRAPDKDALGLERS